MQLQDKVAIVTGGRSGIGAAIVERFRAEGATVVAADITASGADYLDVSDEKSCADLVAHVMARHGRIDAMVNSAGIAQAMPFRDMPAAVFDRLVAVNFRGTFLIGQACARVMTAGASIVNIASVAGMRGSWGRSAYGATKAAVINLTQTMANELAEAGIRVNAIAPGSVETPLVAGAHNPATRAGWLATIPQRRYASPAEIAGSAVYLCGPDASFVTGTILVVDGGFMAAGLQSGTRNAT